MPQLQNALRQATTGIGWRLPHAAELVKRQPDLGFIETHSENHFARGGRSWQQLLQARATYPLSLHGVGLSLGSTDPLDERHLHSLAALIDALEPALVSEHLCWSSVGGVHANDLLPLPYTDEALDHVVARVQQVQERLKRRLLIENVSSYLAYADDAMPEWDFLAAVSRRSGCALLLDINNIHVSARNHGFDALKYLHAVPPEAVAEFHLAGHTVNTVQGADGQPTELLIDTHSRPVAPAVWTLYDAALAHIGPRPTLIEWDSDLPPLDTLLAEAAHAASAMERHDACLA
jgi:uncharacterized protein (UPF0276 family)